MIDFSEFRKTITKLQEATEAYERSVIQWFDVERQRKDEESKLESVLSELIDAGQKLSISLQDDLNFPFNENHPD